MVSMLIPLPWPSVGNRFPDACFTDYSRANEYIHPEFSESFRAEAERSIPLRRFGTCEEVADAAAFLATNQYANNCVLNLDGGLSAM